MIDIEIIKEIALANGFKLKEQASGNMDLHSYVYEFAKALIKEAKQADQSEKCIWRENEDGIWDTECGQDYVFDGYAVQKPSDCGQYCSNCGKKIEEVSFEEIE